MRATWIADLVIQPDYSITGESHHHLAHVVRLEVGEELLLLNGQGLGVVTIVEAISKKEIRLKYKSSKVSERNLQYDLALGMPKKEALDLCLKEATELGFRKIFLIKSQYSQMKFPEEDRLQKILVSALEQSNSYFLPEIISCDWEQLPWGEYGKLLMMDSQSTDRQINDPSNKHKIYLLIVGPEGGFSPEEINLLHGKPQLEILRLPTPILRSATAVAAGAGVILQRLLD